MNPTPPKTDRDAHLRLRRRLAAVLRQFGEEETDEKRDALFILLYEAGSAIMGQFQAGEEEAE